MRFKNPKVRRSLTVQLLLASVGGLVAAIALVGMTLAILVDWQSSTFAEMGVRDNAFDIAASVKFDPSGYPVAVDLPDDLEKMFDGLPKDATFRILDVTGAVLITAAPGPALTMLTARMTGPPEVGTILLDGDFEFRVATVPIDQAHATFYVQMAQSERLTSMVRVTDSKTALQVVIVTCILAALVFGAAITLTLKRMLQPLLDASTAASQISARNLSERIDAAPLPQELRPLIAAFNSALGRLETGYRVQQDFLAAAAHELKTPLALVRAEIELSDFPARDVLLQDIDLMSRQVHQLLHLAEASETHNYVFEPWNANAVLLDVVQYLERLAERHEVRIDAPPAQTSFELVADRGALFTLLKNLIENAIHHAPPHSLVVIYWSGQKLLIQDEGPGIAVDTMPKIFDRFWRGKTGATEGAGLGLSICKEIALAHGWTVSAQNASPQPGAVFTIEMPRGKLKE
ncbi:ATP-binding protein [Achromobacter seleniivolatilans]|uniref:histidine kinase n=1 Tax=Achromobacter seleniivolatilans TaxID=3047478 RepID=A0ABY9M5Q7_9BURK|nr:ATP-binding protein [Achromobacter sp. R39]WMD22150.1 ATP-binding protein [Achromobacter sp. R39]